MIDELRDARLGDLPFVVGDGANERLPEFLALLDAAEELKPKIVAGVCRSATLEPPHAHRASM